MSFERLVRRLLQVSCVLTFAASASTVSFAADLPAPAPVYAPQPAAAAYDWSGFYLGLSGGGAIGRAQEVDNDPSNPALVGLPISNSYNVTGGLAGGTLGYNFQSGNWLIGAEGDLSWVDQKGSTHDSPPFNPNAVQTTEVNWLGTGRLRFGISPLDHWLFYTTGGFAAAGVKATIQNLAGPYSQTQTEWGWTAGAGAEVAFSSNWSVKFEFLYVDLIDATYFSPHIVNPVGTIVTRTLSFDDNIGRVGIDYKFF